MDPSSSTIKKTPLFDLHTKAGAKMIPFGGWMMPVSYDSVLAEHKNVREACGIFDVSHMGEVRVSGPEAQIFLQWLTINDIHRLKVGTGQYNAILNQHGGMIDDLFVYRTGDNDFFICVNASNRSRDFQWILDQSKKFKVDVIDESDNWAQIAVQGPRSLDVMSSIVNQSDRERLLQLPYTHIMECRLGGHLAYIARTGYTGEFGFEVYLYPSDAKGFWSNLLELNQKYNVRPIGLGARDTLRLEACYLLYGNDMNEHVSPLEAGIAWATKLDKGDFFGRAALLEQKSRGIKRQIVAFKMSDEGIPRHGMKVFFKDKYAGEVTSGSVLPTLGGAGGMALLETGPKDGDEIMVEIRGQQKRARICKRPLYVARAK